LMVLALFVHMFSVFFMKAYRNPREFGWWSGLVLLGLTMTFGFSGYLLPMDELSYFATKVGLEIPASIHLIGPVVADLIRGGPTVSDETIQRFFTLHVVVLPMLFALVLIFHLYLVQRHGNAVPPSEEAKAPAKRRSIPFFPDFMVKDLAMWLIALNVLGFLACMVPWGLGPQADPVVAAPAGIHPEWYFMAPFQLLKVLGNWLPGTTGEMVGILLPAVGGLVWAVIPLFDRSAKNVVAARVATWFGILALVGLVGLTVWGYAAL
jgi:quinol-cytochrome oxidoreductase complex cytochrome b subunit